MESNDPNDPQMLERLLQWWEAGNRNPRSMDQDLLDWVLTHHPKAFKITVNKEALNARIKELEA